MTCSEAEPLIGASLDGELDPRAALRIDEHISACGTCSAFMHRLERLRDEISEVGPDWGAERDLRSLKAAIRRALPEPWWRKIWIGGPWLWRSAAGILAAAVLVMVALPGKPTGTIERQMVDNHLRSLLADHLVDVPSSDHHTVKPWFQGKLSFSPAVPDLSTDGFVLTGGRLDVIAGRQAAALVYKRRQHVVNLWISPADGSDSQITASNLEGFHLLHWQKDAMVYWAVSDLNPTELREFAMLIRSR